MIVKCLICCVTIQNFRTNGLLFIKFLKNFKTRILESFNLYYPQTLDPYYPQNDNNFVEYIPQGLKSTKTPTFLFKIHPKKNSRF